MEYNRLGQGPGRASATRSRRVQREAVIFIPSNTWKGYNPWPWANNHCFDIHIHIRSRFKSHISAGASQKFRTVGKKRLVVPNLNCIMPGYKVIAAGGLKTGLVCPECDLVLKEAVQTPEGERLCESCFQDISK